MNLWTYLQKQINNDERARQNCLRLQSFVKIGLFSYAHSISKSVSTCKIELSLTTSLTTSDIHLSSLYCLLLFLQKAYNLAILLVKMIYNASDYKILYFKILSPIFIVFGYSLEDLPKNTFGGTFLFTWKKVFSEIV